jgi:probable phosphoglycerate mutase
MALGADADAATTPGGSAVKARAQQPPPTLILFVRHGTTPTTGKVLPGRAPGLHLADRGRKEAEAVAERLAALAAPVASNSADGPAGEAATAPPQVAAAPPQVAPPPGPEANGSAQSETRKEPAPPKITAVYASPLERAQETAQPISQRLGLPIITEEGLLEMDFGEWTGAELKALRKLPEWETVQRYPSGFQFPGGEAFASMRARIAMTVVELCRRHPGETIVAVSHADPIKTAVADALGTHLDLFQRISIATCSVTAIAYSATGPAVLAVNTTGGIGDLRPAAAQ